MPWVTSKAINEQYAAAEATAEGCLMSYRPGPLQVDAAGVGDANVGDAVVE